MEKRLSCEWLHLITVGVFYGISRLTINLLERVSNFKILGHLIVISFKQAIVFLMVVVFYYFLGDWLINTLYQIKRRMDEDARDKRTKHNAQG